MYVTVKELETNLDKYLEMSTKEDVFIFSEERIVAKLTNPFKDRLEDIKSLFGVLPADIDCEK